MTDQATASTGTRSSFSPRIESLLSSRLFMAPQLLDDTIYFISNMSGRFSLYQMKKGGSVPIPLLPPDIALQNPELMGDESFFVFPKLGKILITIDKDGDENYRPMLIPMEGGIPEPAFDDRFANYRNHFGDCDRNTNRLYLVAESREEAKNESWAANLESGELTKLAEGPFGPFPAGNTEDGSRILLQEQYTFGDTVLRLWERGQDELRLLYGTPLDQRKPDEQYPPNGIHSTSFMDDGRGILFVTSLFEDTYSFGFLDTDHPEEVRPVATTGVRHSGQGELEGAEKLVGSRYRVTYNIDGASWVYE
jgi:hypothetical protein